MNKWIFPTFLAIATSSVVLTGCGGSKATGAIATINGEAIPNSEFSAYLELKPDVRVRTENGTATLPVDGTLGFQALQDMIAQQLTLQLGRDKKIYPSDSEISQEIEFQKKIRPDFLVQLLNRGLTLEMVRKSLALDLIQERLITAGIKKTTADVDAYIKKNPQEFIEPEKVDIYWILVRNKPIEKRVDQELASGVAFPNVASKYSEAPNASRMRGRLIDQTTGQAPSIAKLPAQIQGMVSKMKPGDITPEWVTFVDGRAKFFVEKKTPARPMAMDDTKKEFLRRLLAKREGSQARDLNKEVMAKMKASTININRSQYQEPWKQAVEQFNLQNKLEGKVGSGTME